MRLGSKKNSGHQKDETTCLIRERVELTRSAKPTQDRFKVPYFAVLWPIAPPAGVGPSRALPYN
jgi:hypothetical protein